MRDEDLLCDINEETSGLYSEKVQSKARQIKKLHFPKQQIKDNVYTQDQRMKQREVEGKIIQAN